MTGVADTSRATTWLGVASDTEGRICGTVQIKLAKAKTSKASGETTQKAVIALASATDGKHTVRTTVQDLDIVFGEEFFAGTLGVLHVEGALATKSAVPTGARHVNIAAPDVQAFDIFSIALAANGKAKISATFADGKKASATAQLVQGEEYSLVPVVLPKKKLSFGIWLDNATGEAVCEGLDVEAIGSIDGETLPPRMTFHSDISGDIPLVFNGKKVSPETKGAIKFTYTAKTGAFKGTFPVVTEQNGRTRKKNVKFWGVFVGGDGYGATADGEKLTISQ